MVAPNDLHDEQSRRLGADLESEGRCKPTSNDQQPPTIPKISETQFAGGLTGAAGACYSYQEHEKHSERQPGTVPQRSEERHVDKDGAGRAHDKNSQELDPVYKIDGQKLVMCYGCFPRLMHNGDTMASHESNKFLSNGGVRTL
jgi:hypothetical protein